MLITFRSKAAADVLMLSEHVAPLLALAGKPVGEALPERGVFTAAQLPAAIERLEAALQAEPAPVQDDHADEDLDAETRREKAQAVHLSQRAYPLLDLLRKSAAQGADVTWESASPW